MNQTYDCIVAGFGTGGSIAAIAAARLGLKVLVLEKGFSPGGTHTSGGVPGYYGQDSVGIQKELDTLPEETDKLFLRRFSEKGKHSLETAALKAGVSILYHAVPTGILRNGDRISGVEYLSDEGVCRVFASVLIDGTAEGVLFALAGASFVSGRAMDNVLQPFSNSMLRLVSDEGVIVRNFDAGRMDPCTEPLASRTMLETALVHRKEDYSSAADNVTPAVLPGIREGRHIIPEGGLWTLADCFSGTSAQEVLFSVRTNIDTHSNDLALESDLFLDWMVISSLWGFVCTLPVPRKVLFASGVPGIIAASRCLGVDHDLGHAVRMNGTMGQLGEVAGITAFLAVKSGLSPEKVPYSELKKYFSWSTEPDENNRAVTALEPEEIRAALDSSKPGPGLWSIRCGKAVSAETLRQWMESAPEGSTLRRHCAFALVLLRDSSAVPELKKMVVERDSYRPDFSRKYNHARGYVSVCGLGLLRDVSSLPLLSAVLEDPDPGNLPYEYHSHAVCALLRIGEAHPETRNEIASLFRKYGENPAWTMEARLKGTVSTMKRMDNIFRIAMARALDRWEQPHGIWTAMKSISKDSYELSLIQHSFDATAKSPQVLFAARGDL